MTDQGEPLGERLAKLEGRVTELFRQQETAWKRTDLHGEELSAMKLCHVQAVAKIEADIAHLDRESLKETFGMKTQIAEIGWRVGVVVGGALLALNFVLGKMNLNNLFGKQESNKPTTSSRR